DRFIGAGGKSPIDAHVVWPREKHRLCARSMSRQRLELYRISWRPAIFATARTAIRATRPRPAGSTAQAGSDANRSPARCAHSVQAEDDSPPLPAHATRHT